MLCDCSEVIREVANFNACGVDREIYTLKRDVLHHFVVCIHTAKTGDLHINNV
jgi:hypothetical protein